LVPDSRYEAAPPIALDQSPSPSLFANLAPAVCQTLGIASLRHRSALLELGAHGEIPAGSVEVAYETIAANWGRCRSGATSVVSGANWRWRLPQLTLAAHNRSPEVLLERAIVNACERTCREEWSNQVPVASGIAGSSQDHRRAIDLVQQRGPGHFEFIELKVASDNPLHAAFEIIGYVCLCLLTRRDASAGVLGALLSANRIDARVLAPAAYYSRYRLGSLQRQLDTEIRALGASAGVRLGFGFDVLPASFVPLPGYEDEAMLALLDARSPVA
jgi:hypothetical protein